MNTCTFPRGVHPPEGKEFAEDVAIEVLPTPSDIKVPLLQHIGAPCDATVKSKDQLSTYSLTTNRPDVIRTIFNEAPDQHPSLRCGFRLSVCRR